MKDLKELLNKLGKKVVNSQQNNFHFFTEDSAEGVFSRPEYLDYIQNSPDWHIRNLKDLHDNMVLNRTLTAKPSVEFENGQEYIWCRFRHGNVRQNLRIINKGNMLEFINNYSDRKLPNVSSLEELLSEITNK